MVSHTVLPPNTNTPILETVMGPNIIGCYWYSFWYSTLYNFLILFTCIYICIYDFTYPGANNNRSDNTVSDNIYMTLCYMKTNMFICYVFINI